VNFSAKAAVTASTSIALLTRHPLSLAIERSTIFSRERFAAISTFRNLAHNHRLKLTAALPKYLRPRSLTRAFTTLGLTLAMV
jgi:hypothetical protein